MVEGGQLLTVIIDEWVVNRYRVNWPPRRIARINVRDAVSNGDLSNNDPAVLLLDNSLSTLDDLSNNDLAVLLLVNSLSSLDDMSNNGPAVRLVSTIEQSYGRLVKCRD